MIDKVLNENINKLKLNDDLTSKLINNNIYQIKDIWVYNRRKLKEIGFIDSEIKQISIKLQLLGLDLNKKKTH